MACYTFLLSVTLVVKVIDVSDTDRSFISYKYKELHVATIKSEIS